MLTALRHDTFRYEGKFWTFPPPDFVNPHEHQVYSRYGRGVSDEMRVSEIGIAPRPLQRPLPPIYGGFTHSMRTAKFWAKYKGKPIVLSSNLEFCDALWAAYREEAGAHGHSVRPGEEAGWGGIMVCAETDARAQALFEDMHWFWNQWSVPFGQGLPSCSSARPTPSAAGSRRQPGPSPSRNASCSFPRASMTAARSWVRSSCSRRR